MAAVEQPKAPPPRPNAKRKRAACRRGGAGSLHNSALGSFDHPSRNTSINPVDNWAPGQRESSKNWTLLGIRPNEWWR